VKTISDGMLI